MSQTRVYAVLCESGEYSDLEGLGRWTAAIFVVNLFLGWTLIGWVVALAWAVTKPTQGRIA